MLIPAQTRKVWLTPAGAPTRGDWSICAFPDEPVFYRVEGHQLQRSWAANHTRPCPLSRSCGVRERSNCHPDLCFGSCVNTNRAILLSSPSQKALSLAAGVGPHSNTWSTLFILGLSGLSLSPLVTLCIGNWKLFQYFRPIHTSPLPPSNPDPNPTTDPSEKGGVIDQTHLAY